MNKEINLDSEINKLTTDCKVIKRVKNDIKLMKNCYDEISFSQNEQESETKEFHIHLKMDNNVFDILISKNYPFICPKIKINGVNTSSFFNLPSNRFKDVLIYIQGIENLRQISYLTKEYWSPAYRLVTILKQLNDFKHIKKNIACKLLLDKIKHKYLNRDIDLDSFLFTISIPYICCPSVWM